MKLIVSKKKLELFIKYTLYTHNLILKGINKLYPTRIIKKLLKVLKEQHLNKNNYLKLKSYNECLSLWHLKNKE